ncbi:MAG: hypothetical protein ACKODI_08150 [Acidimicrobiaceae bacterium]
MKFSGFVLSALMSTMAIASCSNDQSLSETSVTTTIETSESTVAPTVVVTTVAASSSSSTTTSVAVSSTSLATTSSTSVSNSSVASGAPTTTVAPGSRPKLSVSQTNNLNPNGTSVTVRGTGFDVRKGVYVTVCTQAAPGPQATCIGGVNIDGSSASSVWVSSNPPGYAVGLTTPFLPDGSFTVELVVVAKSGSLDCTVIKCGVITRSDHLRYTDRTQDVFVPITFSN